MTQPPAYGPPAPLGQPVPAMPRFWQHNDDERRWELMAEDFPREPYRLSYVNDEFIRATAMTPEQLQELVQRKFGVPLPEAAFA